MIKLRHILLSIVIVCFLFLLLSISGVLQKFGPQTENPSIKSPEIDSDNLELSDISITNDSGKNSRGFETYSGADQEIFGLYLPNYDETGKEVSIVRSKYTALFENQIYKIREPIIQFKNISKSDSKLDPKEITVTASEGIINIENSVGTLTGNVVIQLDRETQVQTDNLEYLPSKKNIYTNDKVRIISDKMVISGQGFEIDLASSKAIIKENVIMEILSLSIGNSKGVFEKSEEEKEDDIEDISDIIEKKEEDKKKNESFVRAKGKLVFDLETNVITFIDNVEAYIGELTIFADDLRILLESKKRKVKEIIANGDVLAMDEVNIAKGETLIWDAAAGVTTIKDSEMKAEFLNETAYVTSKKIRLYQNTGWAETPAKGKLVTKSHLSFIDNKVVSTEAEVMALDEDIKTISREAERLNDRASYYEKYKNARSQFLTINELDESNVNITWDGSMLFKNSEHVATFKDNVVIKRTGSKMNCEEMSISFNEKQEIHGLDAKGDIRIFEKKDNRQTEMEADSLQWEIGNKPIEIIGEPVARIKIDNKVLESSEINIYDNGNKIVADDRGNITISTDENPTGGDMKKGRIYLEWQGNMVFRRIMGKASFYDNIKAFKDGMNINCDVLDVFFDHKDNIRRIVALENVYLSTEITTNTEAFGTMLTWDVEQNIVELTGNPLAELRKDGSRTLSKKIFFDVRTKQVTWEGGSQWQIINSKN